MFKLRYLFTLLLLSCILACSASNSTLSSKDQLIGKNFPSVVGSSLSGKETKIPEDYRGQNLVVLIGYKQKTQFDIDRWILGLLQADVKAKIIELPTIAGMMPQVVQSFIDNGMRSGIPKEDWADVITVYEDADKIIQALGNERPQSAYLVALNKSGQIIWFSNVGYSASQVLELKKLFD